MIIKLNSLPFTFIGFKMKVLETYKIIAKSGK